MADEPRRSGRATKGQHTKNTESADTPSSKRQKGKGKAVKAPSTEPADDEDDAIIRCVCGFQEDNGGRTMIACDNCDVWQHNDCMGLPEDEEDQPDKYYCEQCRPEDHKELLDGMARGEKPWEARQRAAAELRKQKKKKKPKGRGQGKLARPSDAGSQHEAPSSSPKPQQSTPTAVKQEAGIKRKREDGDGQNGQTEQSTETQLAADIVPPLSSAKTKRSSLPNIGARRQSAPKGSENRRDSTGPVYAESIDELAPERRRPAKVIQDDLAGLIRQAAQQGSYRIPDGETAASLSTRLGLHIEHALYVHFGGTSNGYADQFRSIRFNIKRNVDLLNGLLQATLSPEQLAAMSSDDMVDEETRRQNAAIKEAADKQAILIHEEGPRIRKTHKGEEVIGEDTIRRESEQTFPVPPIRHRETAEDTEMGTAVTPPAEVGSPTMVELPEDVGTRRPLTVDTSPTSPPAPPHRQSTAGFDINQVWSSVQSPETDQQRLLQRPPRRRSSVIKQQPIQGPGDDAEIDRLLKDEDDDVPMYSPVTQEAASTNIWRGKLGMQGIGQCHGTARHVAGGAVHNKFSYSALLGHDLDISGRIAVERADEYVSGMRVSLTTDVTVLSLTPSNNDDDRAAFQNIFNYFHAKQRWGVIAKFPHEAVRDVYVVPLEAGIAKPPSFLEDLEYNVIENVRPDNMLLVTMVIRHKSPVPSAQATPQQTSDVPAQVAPPAPAPAPMQGISQTAVGQPQFSPVAPYPGSNPMSSNMNNGPGQSPAYGSIPSPYNAPLPFSPPTPANQMAAQVLGPFISAPVVGQMLNMVQDITEQQLRNLRDILENEPATRSDLNMLASHLMQKNSQQQ